jgi:AAA ATPase domain
VTESGARGSKLGDSEGSRRLVGRARELVEIEGALRDAARRHGRLVLIAGEPGIGKTCLAEAVSGHAATEGMLPLWGRVWESAGAPAYWPWIQLLRTLIGTRDPPRLETELGAGATWLVQMLPELSDLLPSTAVPRARDAEKARFALFDAVTRFLRNAADQTPLVIVLEDLHAADPDSLLLLDFAARAIADARILLLGTYQHPAAHLRPDAEKLIGAASRDGATITLQGFDERDVGRLVEQCTGQQWPPEFLRALRATTEGNPFFTSEVARLMSAEGTTDGPLEADRVPGFPLPNTVREAIRRRFESLTPGAVQVLEAAAVIGREFQLPTLQRAAGEKENLVGAIEEAVSAGLIAEMPGSIGRFRFTHNLIRETLYSGVGRARRVQLHRAVGEALESLYGEAPAHLVELAHHFAEASPGGDADKALYYAVSAARQAMRFFAYEQAAELYELALSLTEMLQPDPHRHAELLLALGQARARADHLASRDALVAAADAARVAGDPRLLAEAGLAIRAFPRGSGVLDNQPSGLLNEALEWLDDTDSPLRAKVLARLGVSLYYWPGTEEQRRSLAKEAVAMARRLDEPATLAHVLSNAQLATWGPDTTELDLGWMEELLPLTQEIGDDELELAARNRQIDFLIELGRLAEAESALTELALTASHSADPRTEAYVGLHAARLAIIDGRYADAERMNAHAAAEGARLRDPTLVGLAGAQLFSLRWPEGRLAELEEATREAAATDATPAWSAALALVWCEIGKETEARRQLERLAARDFRDLPRYNGWLVTMAVLSEVAVRLGDVRLSERLSELLEPFAGRNVITPQAAFVGPVARFLAILAGARSDWEAVEAHLLAAREAAERMNSRPVRLRVTMDEVEMRLKRDHDGDRERALELLDEADALVEALGVDSFTERVERLRGAIGAERPSTATAAAARPALPPSACLRREGDVWTFELDQRSVRLRDSKGLRCLAVLLANPGAEIYAAELARPGEGSDPRAGDQARAEGLSLRTAASDDAGPLLDAEAKSAYRRRLEELHEELDEAESFNDPERAAGAREEIDFLTRELAGAVGLGGRDRKAASNPERARVSVTKAIRATIKRVGEHDPELGHELGVTIRTGTFCTYQPDPRRPLVWRVDLGSSQHGALT